MASVGLLQLPISQPELIALSDLLTTDSTEINWIFLVIVIGEGLRIYRCVKHGTLRSDLTKAGHWTQENVNWETTPWEQVRLGSVREVPWAAGQAGTSSSLEALARTMGFSSWTQRVVLTRGFMYVVSSEPEPTPFSCKRLTLDTYWSQFKQSLF